MQKLFLLYNKISIIFYLFQHILYSNLSIYYDQLNLLKLVSLFGIGLMTSLSPCFISILPLIISSTITLNSLSTKIMILIGLMNSFILIIYILYIGHELGYVFNNIPILLSIIWIFIALNLLGIIRKSFSLNNTLLNRYHIHNIFIQSYIIGFGIGLASLSCNSSLILTTVLWLYNSNTIIDALIYLLGCLLPFSIIFLLPSELFKFQLWVNFLENVMPLGGFYMLIIGVFNFCQQLL